MSIRIAQIVAIKITLCGLVPLLSFNSFAADWVTVAGNKSIEVQMDKSSIVRSAETARAWTKYIFTQPRIPKGQKADQAYKV